jgi:hypothetical protein
VKGDEVMDGEEAAMAVFVQSADQAGNVWTASGPVVFDFKPPGILPGTFVRSLAPAASNVLRGVTKATAGTWITLAFLMSEPLAGVPAVGAVNGARVIPIPQASATGPGCKLN